MKLLTPSIRPAASRATRCTQPSWVCAFSDNRHYALDVAMSKPLGDHSIYNPDRKMRYSLVLSYNLDP